MIGDNTSHNRPPIIRRVAVEVPPGLQNNLIEMAPRGPLIHEQSTGSLILRFISHLNSANALYDKPNVAVVGQMMMIVVSAVFIVSIVFQDESKYSTVLVIFGIDVLIEVSIVTFLGWTSNPIFRYPMYIAAVSKSILIILVSIDLNKGTMISVYLSPLILIPYIMTFYRKCNYAQIKINSIYRSIIFTVVEVMLLVKCFTRAKLSYYSIFVILFYYCLVTFFFHILNLVSACFQVIHAVGTCWRDFKWRMFAVQFCLGFDNLVALFLALIFANWTYAMERLMDSRTSKDDLSDALSDVNYLKTWLKRISVLALIYAVVRCIALYASTRDNRGNNVRFALSNIGIQRRPPTPVVVPEPQVNPRVVKLSSGSSSFLNLFRINANFYSTSNNKVMPEIESKPDDDQCTICCSKLSDCIIMDCRHGGICKDCALSMLKKSTQCPFCRNKIKRICVVKKHADNKYKITEEIMF